ncbi:MAG: hypothetical protein Kow0031_29620 [Anaerolineae bacterium]
MPKPHNIVSFVLRFTQELWSDPQGEPHIRWRGHIRHVQGTDEERFTDFAEAVTFMQRYLTALTKETLAGVNNASQEKVFAESVKLWNQLATGYAEMMTQAMEQSMKQSETIREQLDEAGKKVFDAWQIPYPSGQDELLKAIKQLNREIATLSKRVESLENRLDDN